MAPTQHAPTFPSQVVSSEVMLYLVALSCKIVLVEMKEDLIAIFSLLPRPFMQNVRAYLYFNIFREALYVTR
jgi:hypothetical protein